ncbi:30S ribosomal protein S2 [Candidatus Bathyarchaeota archaeon]|nr:MAG: 30S ribosomal protein S2 [Candidatus Bathyarchaeota archaeon]RJS78547.1 MAG: 30S ribosomal protein S2 [Candidatus Bathyarchaeota archaeon]RLG95754.1 MAG: 30S ribosomal protein S2 [Candidatus Bathyarchaeota archaeon]
MAEEESKEVDEAEETQEEELLLPQEELLSAGVHIGTKMKTKDMEPFIYRVRPDGLFVLDVKKTNERIKVAAKFLARFEPSKIAVVAARLYAREPVRKFCEVTGAIPVVGRFVPGSLSNPLYPRRIEPDVVMVSDPRADSQAIRESTILGIPVVALCSTDNNFSNIDLVIPTNNKGRRALAIIYWLLARQFLREKGEIPPDGDLPIPVEEFEVKLVQKPA